MRKYRLYLNVHDAGYRYLKKPDTSTTRPVAAKPPTRLASSFIPTVTSGRMPTEKKPKPLVSCGPAATAKPSPPMTQMSLF